MLHKIADRFEVLKPRPGFAWERLVKQPRALGTLLLRVYPLVVGRFTSRWGHAIFVFSCTVRRLWLKQGSKGLVLFLKSCYVATQQAAGGYRIPNVQLVGARIARTSGGLPRIIMKDHRSLIRSGAPWVVAMYLTLFGLYRVIEYPGKVKIRTITDLCLLRQADLSLFEGFIPLFYLKLVYCVSSKARSLGIGNKTAVSPKFVAQELDYQTLDSPHPTLRPTKFTLILKASPTSAPLAGAEVDPLWVHRDADSLKSPFYQLKERCGLLSRLFRPLSEDERGILQAMWKRWKESKKRTSSAGSLFWTTSIWMGSALLPFLIEWVKLTDAKVIKQLFKAAYTKRFNKLNPWGTSAKLGEPFKATSYDGLGKLGFKDEPAGKVRVFAMVDVITQTLMSPLHE